MNMHLNSSYSVFELGINKPNEMTKLVKTLHPHYCLVTGIENSHIENFRNFNQLIVNKLKIFDSKRLISGLINYNYDSRYIKKKIGPKVQCINTNNIEKKILKNKRKFIVNFSINKRKHTINSYRGEFCINIAIISYLFIRLFIKNIKFKTFFYDESIIESRGKKVFAYISNKKVSFYDHSYNASPYSLNKQILIFNERNIKQKVYILGSMKELGYQSDYFHNQIIKLVINLNLKHAIFIGDEFYKFNKKFNKLIFYKNYVPVIKYLNKEVKNFTNIFVMGSRSNQLDRLIKEYVK